MKNTSHEDSIFRKKGFFIALYSCLGAVAVLALVITIASNVGPSYQAEGYDQDAALVGADQVAPYLAQVDDDAWFRPRQTPAPPPQPTPTPRAQPPRTTPPPSEMPPPEPQGALVFEVEYDQAYYEYDYEYDEYALQPEEPPTVAEYVPRTFSPFAEGDVMMWPVDGAIAMQFSIDTVIYDPTLAHFRTNDDLRIYAAEGDGVRAAADGRVLSIGRNVVRGSYVKIDHGNGLVATYGQLADNKLVSVGDIVFAGQYIGMVGRPSIFGSMHGNHVNLRITRDDVPVNPNELLAARVE